MNVYGSECSQCIGIVKSIEFSCSCSSFSNGIPIDAENNHFSYDLSFFAMRTIEWNERVYVEREKKTRSDAIH